MYRKPPYCPLRNKLWYHLQPRSHTVYLCFIPEANVLKVGRSAMVAFRIRNLRASLYQDHEIHTITCQSPQQSLNLDRYLKKHFKGEHVRGEWFRTTPAQVRDALDNCVEFAHLDLVLQDSAKVGLVQSPPKSFTVAF